MSELTDPCKECGMLVKQGEYHPYTACLMFKGCNNSNTVRVNLKTITTQWLEMGKQEQNQKLQHTIETLTAAYNSLQDSSHAYDTGCAGFRQSLIELGAIRDE